MCCFSGRDQFQPGQEEGERLSHALPTSEIRKFNNSGHFLFLVGLSLSLSLPVCVHACKYVCTCVLICVWFFLLVRAQWKKVIE